MKWNMYYSTLVRIYTDINLFISDTCLQWSTNFSPTKCRDKSRLIRICREAIESLCFGVVKAPESKPVEPSNPSPWSSFPQLAGENPSKKLPAIQAWGSQVRCRNSKHSKADLQIRTWRIQYRFDAECCFMDIYSIRVTAYHLKSLCDLV